MRSQHNGQINRPVHCVIKIELNNNNNNNNNNYNNLLFYNHVSFLEQQLTLEKN